METDVLSGGTRDSRALVWNSIQHGCKQRWKESMADLHSSTWAGEGTKLPDVEKTIQLPLNAIIWYTCCKKKKKGGLYMAATWSLSCSHIRSLLFCADREQIILTRQIWQSACADCIQHESLDRRSVTAATSTLLHNVAAPLHDLCGRRPLRN